MDDWYCDGGGYFFIDFVYCVGVDDQCGGVGCFQLFCGIGEDVGCVGLVFVGGQVDQFVVVEVFDQEWCIGLFVGVGYDQLVDYFVIGLC